MRASQLISSGRPLVSLQPLAALRDLAAHLAAQPALRANLQGLRGDRAVRAWLAEPGTDAAATAFAAAATGFIDRYGDRGIGELKLETPTFRSHPSRLIQAVLAWDGQASSAAVRADAVRAAAVRADAVRAEGNDAVRSPEQNRSPLRVKRPELPLPVRPLAAWLAAQARKGVEGRELSRLDRSRLFGMVRSLVRLSGDELVSKGLLDSVDDVFYLTLDEVFAPLAKIGDARAKVAARRQELSQMAGLPAYSRVEFSGPLRARSPIGQALNASQDGSDMVCAAGPDGIGGQNLDQRQGQGCGGARATGRVMVVREAITPAQAAGRILVTEVTDPGWVFTLAAAAGVVSQKGSLLSHSAIVARELGVPFVAALTGATSWLREGDLVEMDGQTGLVRRLAAGDQSAVCRKARDQETGG
jgi:pyruvate,water dikinase